MEKIKLVMREYIFKGIEDLISVTDDNNEWRVQIDPKISLILKDENFPLKLKILNHYGKKILWEIDLFPDNWASWPSPKNTDLLLENRDGFILKMIPFNRMKYRDCIDDVFYYFVVLNKLKNGLVLGAGSGTYGEWVYPVLNYHTNAVLVEPGIAEIQDLTSLFNDNHNVKIINKGVDTETRNRIFWISSTGNVSSLDKEVSLKYVREDSLTPVEMEFISINDLINHEFYDRELEWIRLDVEGMDSKIIFSMDEEILKKVKYVQYEHINVTEEEKISTNLYLESLGFFVYMIGIDMVAIRK